MGLCNYPNMMSVDSHLIEGLAVSEGKCGDTPLSVPPDLMIDEPQVDGSHSAVKAIEHQSNNPANLKHESPHINFHILEDAQVASMAAVPGHEGKSVDTGSDTFDILLGALAEESKATHAPGKDEVGKASLTLMTLASNEPSADDVTDVRAVEVVETDTMPFWDQQKMINKLICQMLCLDASGAQETDIICNVRRKHKRKRDSQSNTDTE
ncbi:unnamed protein product [Miscanthus lutarioriparius]|uniref:Uncharacterized protein n=1 Tax=Miscanthus lutarioriparius TaxID=422564 RepID=A0A811RFM3_9POAL|nr:unnamed protein product [Miscanthus lutarioriparius]